MSQAHGALLAARIAARAALYPQQARPGRFGLLTTVYIGTDAPLFAETAACLFAQTQPFDSWTVLAHGPVSPALDQVLAGLGKDPRVRLLREPVNLGIMGGMRVCLDAATTEYVVPMDADDLLTPDALQVLSAEIDRTGAPALLYSDEDILVGGVAQAPYWRPDWDPVLNLSSSYIWHLCCIRRDAALAAGLYTDPGANFCHDWDTAFRLAAAEGMPVHVPEVLYHWRQHPASTTNRATGASDGSRASTRHLLERFVARQARPHLYEIADFPIFRGAAEWYVFRKPEAPPAVAVLSLGGPPPAGLFPGAAGLLALGQDTAPRGWWPWARRPQPATPSLAVLRQALAGVAAPHVLLLGPGVRPTGADAWWEAIKLVELHPEVAVVGGVLTDAGGRILRGAEVLDDGGQLLCPQRGQRTDNPGPFALWLKPQCVDAVATDFCLVETALLRDVLAALPESAGLGGLGVRLAAAARAAGRLVAWSPLVRAAAGPWPVDGPAQDLPALAASVMTRQGQARPAARRSRLARYAQAEAEAIFAAEPAASPINGPV